AEIGTRHTCIITRTLSATQHIERTTIYLHNSSGPSRARRHLLVSQLTIQFLSATLSEVVFYRGETRAGDTWEGRKEQSLRAILVMGSQARRRRPTRPSPNTCPFLTRALGVACLAGATTLSAAFVTPAGCRGGFYGINSAAAAASATTVRQRGSVGDSNNRGGARNSPIRLRRNHLAMVSATAEPPAATATDADAWA
ncbi:unnamed protein product, partial [Ectocarpus sp. 12 AP-2014]